ncbi:transposase, partial [Paraburkholderia atlantica]|uniref:transposase n=1 Tax=Paraburkholderia atlantica TaxID=2654982 RepID=UPI00187DD670
MNTIEEEAPVGRRRRRRYSVEFKAQVVAACRRPGVSLAAIALDHWLNANLLRRWVEQAEGNARVPV